MATFWTGLNSPFQGDDILQIVKNVPVHSVKNIRIFFEGGTFYNGRGLAPLSGDYFRPLMSTSFSLIYSIFGPHPLYFHIFQLLLCISSAFIFYLFLRYSFKGGLSIFLALLLLVHPIDSEMAFSIPVTQDALYFFFGILALYILVRFKSMRSLIGAAACLLLSLLSKETAVVFVVMSAVYLFWWDRRRLLPFIAIFALPFALYMVLRIHAIGLLPSNPYSSPLDELSLTGRLVNAPSVILFYFTKFVFPWKLATGYFWVYKTFSIKHVLLPLIIDLAVFGLIIYGANQLRRHSTKAMFYTYIYFAIWLAVSLLLIVHIIPVDATAAEPWFYASMVGVLGMLGVILTVWQSKVTPKYLFYSAIIILIVLGVRTALHGLDWQSDYKLQMSSVAISKEDYVGYMDIAQDLQGQGKLKEAELYERQSISIFPVEFNYSNLGVILTNEHNFPGALNAYEQSLKYGHAYLTYEDIGALTLFSNNYAINKAYLSQAINLYPKDSTLWLYLALLEDRNNDNADAKISIEHAVAYGQVPSGLALSIMQNQPFNIQIVGEKVHI